MGAGETSLQGQEVGRKRKGRQVGGGRILPTFSQGEWRWGKDREVGDESSPTLS